MFDFDGAIAPKTLEEWEDVAIESIESSSVPPQLLVVLGLGAGFLVSGLAPFMAIGLIPPILAFRTAWMDNNRKSKMHDVSAKFAYAAVLGKAELQEYSQQFGMKAAIAQIDWAKRSGIPLSDPAEILLARYKRKYKALLPPAIEQPPTVDVAAIALLPESPNTPDTQAVGNDTRLGAIAATAAEVEDGPVDELWADDWATPLVSGDLPQPDPDGDRYAWADDLIHFPAVLIYGPQGSGKSSFTSWLLRERIKAGHAVEVWDVHRKFGHWKGLAVHGSGLNYEAVDSRMGSFRRQVQARYLKEATVANPNHSWYTAVCEELTNFQEKCENVAPLFKQSLSDLRKIKMCVIYCSHGRTLGTLGGSKGTADMRDSGLIELELQAKINPVTRELVSAQKGKLKLPNRSPISVEIADWMRGSVDFSDLVQVANPVNEVAIASVPIVAEQEDAGEGVLDAKQNSKRVGDKVVQGLRSSGSEWVSLSPFLRDSFNNTEDRAIAKHLIGRAIVKGQLEMEERENTNKSKSVFVRVKRKLFANTNPD